MLTYSVILLLFAVYSYSQIDLNLTLSANEFYQSIQNSLIRLGYFNRPVSTVIYLSLVFSLSVIYLYFLKYGESFKKLKKLFIILIAVNILIGLISYPAYSHDLFNYMFDARIVTKYGLNPYQYRALDFPGDLWIRFMHWTHRTYPYGPLWIILTLPFSFLGFAKFIPTLFLFKLMFVFFYIGSILLIKKIRVLNKENFWNAVVFYAFNPLILIETLISPHNESAILFFMLMSFYYFYQKKNFILSIISVTASFAVKYTTVVLIPLYFIINIREDDKFLRYCLLMLLIPLIVLIFNREPYPWYFIPFIGISSLMESRLIKKLVLALSLGFVLRYAPFVYFGLTEPLKSKFIMNILLILPSGLYFLFILIKSKGIYRPSAKI